MKRKLYLFILFVISCSISAGAQFEPGKQYLLKDASVEKGLYVALVSSTDHMGSVENATDASLFYAGTPFSFESVDGEENVYYICDEEKLYLSNSTSKTWNLKVGPNKGKWKVVRVSDSDTYNIYFLQDNVEQANLTLDHHEEGSGLYLADKELASWYIEEYTKPTELSVVPMKGEILQPSGMAAVYDDMAVEYEVSFGDIIPESVLSFTINDNPVEELPAIGEDGRIEPQEVKIAPGRYGSNYPVRFELTYMNGSEPVTSAGVAYARVYKKPKAEPKIKLLSNAHQIGEGEFKFECTGVDEDYGDPSYWKYSWYVNERPVKDQEGRIETFKLKSGDHKVQLMVSNSIQGSSNEEYSRHFYSSIEPVYVYDEPSVDIKEAPSNILDNQTLELKFTLKGGQPGKWSSDATIIINGQIVKGTVSENTVAFSYPVKLNVPSNGKKILKISNINVSNRPEGADEDYPAKASGKEITVWPEAKVETLVEDSNYDIPSDGELQEFEGNKEDTKVKKMRVRVTGGMSTADNPSKDWTFEWSHEGIPISGENSDSYTLVMHTDAESGKYTVKAQYVLDEKVVYEESINWDIKVWSYPTEPKIDAIAYEGEKGKITITPNGGYLGDNGNGGWEYQLYYQGKPEGPAKLFQGPKTITLETEKNITESNKNDYKLQSKCLWKDGKDWDSWADWPYIQTVAIELIYEPSVKLDDIMITEAPSKDAYSASWDVYYNKGISFGLNKQAGIEGKWNMDLEYTAISGSQSGKKLKVSYSNDKTKRGITTCSLDKTYVENGTTEKKTVKITGTISNGEGDMKRTWDVDFTVTVWPRAQVSDFAVASGSQVREGDPFSLRVSTNGGYNAMGMTKAKYNFIYGQSPIIVDTPIINVERAEMVSGTTKERVEQTVDCEVTILGPNGETWETLKATPCKLYVYRRPEAPFEVLMKGSGASRTYIINLTEGSSDLQYVFSDMSNNLRYADDRYIVAPEFDYATVKGATYWTYSDGSKIFSDFRQINGAMESTRGICAFGDPASRVVVDETDGIVELNAENTSDKITVLDLQGRRISKPQNGRLYIINGKKVMFR